MEQSTYASRSTAAAAACSCCLLLVYPQRTKKDIERGVWMKLSFENEASCSSGRALTVAMPLLSFKQISPSTAKYLACHCSIKDSWYRGAVLGAIIGF